VTKMNFNSGSLIRRADLGPMHRKFFGLKINKAI